MNSNCDLIKTIKGRNLSTLNFFEFSILNSLNLSKMKWKLYNSIVLTIPLFFPKICKKAREKEKKVYIETVL